MTRNGKPITPLRAAKEIYIAFGEQVECMGLDEAFDFINVEKATVSDERKTRKMLAKISSRVRRLLGI